MSPIEHLFPGLTGTAFRFTSPKDKNYNCIAWIAGDTNNWWWPDPDPRASYWPPGIPRVETLEAVLATLESLGFEPCDDAELQQDYEKAALFAAEDAPTHVARQLASGLSTSKLGASEDIEHELYALEGALYGKVAAIMERPTPAP